jgi:ArsR family transcriptional regulator
LGHPVRLEILGILVAEGEACVCHLQARLGLRQAYLSQQLARLRQAGLVVDRREGLNVFYRPVTEGIGDLLRVGDRLEADLRDLGDALRASHLAGSKAPQPCPCPRCQGVEHPRPIIQGPVSRSRPAW